MAAAVEYRCFVGGLAWTTDERGLADAFRSFGDVLESKIINDRETGRSRGFGFVTFDNEQSMLDAIESMNGKELDGRNITVNQAQSRSGGNGGGGGGGYRGGYGGARHEDRGGYGNRSNGGNYGGRDRGERSYGGGRGGGHGGYGGRGGGYGGNNRYGGGGAGGISGGPDSETWRK